MEDAQRLWQLEKERMQETMKKQKDEMVEDKQWLKKEEKLLVWIKTYFLTQNYSSNTHSISYEVNLMLNFCFFVLLLSGP